MKIVIATKTKNIQKKKIKLDQIFFKATRQDTAKNLKEFVRRPSTFNIDKNNNHL